jgi:hypothetical protein
MKRRDPRARESGAHEGLDAGTHFFRGFVGERHRENLIVLREALREQIGDALCDDAGLPRARAGKNEKRAVDVKNGFALFGIEAL